MSIAHAKLSASGSHRWITCPASIRQEALVPTVDGNTSYAAEGTAAHALGEYWLKNNAPAPIGTVFKESPNYPVTDEMIDYVSQYVETVLNIVGNSTTPAHLMVEKRVDFSHVVPEGFGTCDAIVVTNNNILNIIDLKYGMGVAVDAFENTQGILYAIGAMHDYGFAFNILAVNIIIVQPRKDSISEYTITIEELREWEEKIKGYAELALSDDAPYNPSVKGCQFCKAKATCPALYDFTSKTLSTQFDDLTLTPPEQVSESQLANLIKAKPLITSYFEAVEAYLQSKLESGATVEGFKLVESRTFRAWSSSASEQDIVAILGDKAYEPPKLISPAKAEKVLGKKDAHLLDALIIKPQGKATLALADDKRKGVSAVGCESFDAI